MNNQFENNDELYQNGATLPKKNNQRNKLREFTREYGVRRVDYNRFLIVDDRVPQFQEFIISNKNAKNLRPAATKSLYHIFGSIFRRYYHNNRMEDIGAAWQKFKIEGEETYRYCKTLIAVDEIEGTIENYFDSLSRENIQTIKQSELIYDNNDLITEVAEKMEDMYISPPQKGSNSNNMRRLAQNLVRNGNNRLRF